MLSEEQLAQLVSNCSLAAMTEMCLRILQSLFGKRIPSKHIYRLVLKFWTGYLLEIIYGKIAEIFDLKFWYSILNLGVKSPTSISMH